MYLGYVTCCSRLLCIKGGLWPSCNLHHFGFCPVDGAGGGVYIGQGHGAVPLHAGKGRVWEVLQAAPGPQAAHQQECLWWLREEHDLEAQGEQECYMTKLCSSEKNNDMLAEWKTFGL